VRHRKGYVIDGTEVAEAFPQPVDLDGDGRVGLYRHLVHRCNSSHPDEI
jgi:hypothetical protein